MRTRTWVILGCIVAIGLGGWYFLRTRRSAPQRPAMNTITLQPSTLIRTLTETGSVESVREATLTSTVSGRVVRVLASVGMDVDAASTLFTMEDTSLQAKAQQADAALAKAQGALEDLLEGATDADIATQERAVESARRARLQTKASLATNERVWQLELAAAQRSVQVAIEKAAKASTDAQTALHLASLEDASLASDLAAAHRKRASAETLQQAREIVARDDLDAAEQKRDRAARDLRDTEDALAALPPTAPDSERRQLASAVTKAEDALDDAETNIDSVRENNALDAKQQEDAVANAEDAVDQANRQLETKRLQSSQTRASNDDAITQAHRDRTSAEEERASKEASIALDRQNAETSVADADSKLANEKAKLATLTEAPDARTVAAARAEVVGAEFARTEAQDALADAAVKAPFAGTVTKLSLYEGQEVAANAAVGTFSDLRQLRVLVNIPESEIGIIAAGQKATVTFDSVPGVSFVGTVEPPERTPTVSSGVVFYATHIGLDATQEGVPQLLPGLTANVTIQALNVPNVLIVPTRALGGTAAKRTVKVRRANGTIEERAVTLGRRGDDGLEILTGLQAGDTIVVSGDATTTIPQPTGGGFRGAGRVL